MLPASFNRTRLVGLPYRHEDVRNAFAKKKVGTKLLLVPEPANKHDNNAIAVFSALTLPNDSSQWRWCHVGYIPAVVSSKLQLKEIVEATLDVYQEVRISNPVIVRG